MKSTVTPLISEPSASECVYSGEAPVSLNIPVSAESPVVPHISPRRMHFKLVLFALFPIVLSDKRYNSDGSFKKFKARLVVHGDLHHHCS